MSLTKTTSVALICRPGHEWKFKGLRRLLAPHCKVAVLCDRDLGIDDLARLSAYDLVFFKSKNVRFLEVMARLEALGTTTVINPVDAVRLTRHRQRGAVAVAAAGVPVVEDYIGPLAEAPFERFVIKGEFEDDPMIPIIVDSPASRATAHALCASQSRIYAQRYVESPWEYKYYCVAGDVFAFRQRPTAVNPDKMATRRPIGRAPQLVEYTRRAMQATGLELIGVDFLVEAGQPYLTDINSTQGLWSFEAGCKALFEYLLRRLDEPMTSQQRSNA